ncbi:hypothetical protein [Burkholderia phage BCSR5]|nr:hypothetical protein [Burkholderia phage BCSR5]
MKVPRLTTAEKWFLAVVLVMATTSAGSNSTTPQKAHQQSAQTK